MKNKNVKRISMILAALMVAGAATGCGAKKDTKVENTNKVATNSTKLDEDAIKDTYTGIEDMYVLEGSKDVDYLDGRNPVHIYRCRNLDSRQCLDYDSSCRPHGLDS